MIYLYIKICNHCGLKYLGKTKSTDPHKYRGSVKYWLLHLKKHNSDWTTDIIFESEDIEEIKEKGLYYSKLWNITSSDDWANLVEENGGGNTIAGKFWITDGDQEFFLNPNEEFNKEIYRLGRADNIKRSVSIGNKGKPGWNKNLTKETDPRVYAYSLKLKNKVAYNKNKIWVYNKVTLIESFIFETDFNPTTHKIGRSPILKDKLSELDIIITDGKVDKKFNSSEVIPDGWKRGSCRDQKGFKNPSFGKIWITDGVINKYIKNNKDLPHGFRKGRTMKKK